MPTSDADAYMKAQSCRVCPASDKAVKALEYARGLLSEERRLQRAHLLKRPRADIGPVAISADAALGCCLPMHPIPHQGYDVADDVTEDRRHKDKRNGCGEIKGAYLDSKMDHVCPEDEVIEELSQSGLSEFLCEAGYPS